MDQFDMKNKIKFILYFSIKEFICHVSGCKSIFQTLIDYEIHYNTSHRYVCTECKTSRPNPHLLEIHIQETHDTFFKVLSKKQAMVIIKYLCIISLYISILIYIYILIFVIRK